MLGDKVGALPVTASLQKARDGGQVQPRVQIKGKARSGSPKVKLGSQSAGLGRSPAQQATWPGQSGSPGTASSLSPTFPGGTGLPWDAPLLICTCTSADKPLGREVLSYVSTVSLAH